MSKIDYDPDDRLDGAQAIADYAGISLRRTFYLLEQGELPAGKLGNKWTGSKRLIGGHLQSVARSEASEQK